MVEAAKPFKFRGRWRAQVMFSDGTRPTCDFDKYDDALKWMAEQCANANTQHQPELGGPKPPSLTSRRHCQCSAVKAMEVPHG